MPAPARKTTRPKNSRRPLARTTMMHVRVDEGLKEQATETLAHIGLSVTDAVKLFLNRIVIEQALPLDLKVPNAKTRAAMEEARTMGPARFSTPEELFNDLEKGSER
jgi:DNA-damage-inducible protein J